MCPESWNCLIGTKCKYIPLVYSVPCLCFHFVTGMWCLFQHTELNFYECGIFVAFICCLFISWKTFDFCSQILVFGNPQLWTSFSSPILCTWHTFPVGSCRHMDRCIMKWEKVEHLLSDTGAMERREVSSLHVTCTCLVCVFSSCWHSRNSPCITL